MLLVGGNENGYPKIIKNISISNLSNINFIMLRKLDNKYHDNFVKLLKIKKKFIILEKKIIK